ncbi:CD3337/EF1877 family mobilome membrane protein [Oceanobacillus oncorhynchi]|uniref:CD3337/EF1877 family mobilome membrane protein n=1 Tax=Oceanobacillus oncorhynchi TaxID=545501 RepID=UPI0034D5D1A6
MKNKKWLLGIFAIILFCLTLSSTTVLAEEDDEEGEGDKSENPASFTGWDIDDDEWEVFNMIYRYILGEDFDFDPSEFMDEVEEQDTDETGGIELEINRWDIEKYSVNTEDLSGMINGNLNQVSNAIMAVNHTIAEITDTAFDELFTNNTLNRFADDVQTVTSSIYDELKKRFVEVLFLILIAYLAYLFFAKGNLQAVLKKSLVFALVVIVAGYWIANSAFLLKTLNYWADEGQGYLVDAGNSMLEFTGEKEGVFADIDEIDEDNTLDGTVAVLRNLYFDLAVKRPYLMINYDDTDEKSINENDNIGEEYGWGFDNYSRVDRMLSFETSSDGMAYRSMYAQAEVIHERNNSMGAGGAWRQFGLVLLTLITTIFLSVPFLILGALNFILQLLLLALAFIIPFMAIISYIPQFANSLFKTFGKMGSVLVLKILLGVFMLFVYLIAFVVNNYLPPNSTGMYYLNVIAIAGLIYFLFIKRDAVISLITAGYVASLDKNMMTNINKGMNNAKNNLQGHGKDFKQKFMPTRKPSKPVNSPNSKNNSPTDDKYENNPNPKTKTGKESDSKQIKRTPQLSKTDKENSRVAKNRKLTPIERTKQMLSRRKKGQPDNKKQDKKNQSEEIKKKQNIDDKRKPSTKKPIKLNKDYKAKRNNQSLQLDKATTKRNNQKKVGLGVYDIGEGEEIDPKQKIKPIRSPQNLDVKKSKKMDKNDNLDIKEGVNKKNHKDYKSTLYDEYDVERNRGIESVEQKKKDRKIDKELS